MSGFDKNEPYVIDEMTLNLPWSLRTLEKIILPKLDDWRSQSNGRAGDKSECANNILNEVIPYLVEALVKRGIFFVKKYPENPMSQILLSIPGYEMWAIAARNTVKARKETRGSDKIQELNVGARASYEALCRRQDTVDNKLAKVLKALREEKEKTRRIESLLMQISLSAVPPPAPTQQQQYNNNNASAERELIEASVS